MIKNPIKIFFIFLLVAAFSSCNIFESSSTSNSVLLITSITGADSETPIFSDVSVLDNDVGIATLTAQLINPDSTISSYYQDIIVDQIDVEFSRADGLDQEGKDIPFSFSQKVHMMVPINSTVSLSYSIIQQVAKIEPPLVDLLDWGEEQVLKLEARCTFHGYDVGGNRIEPVVGTVSVWCANFGGQ